MSRLPAAAGQQMPVLRKASADREARDEEAVPAVWRIGIQDGDGGRCAARAEKDSEDYRLRSLREAGVAGFRAKLFLKSGFAGYSEGWYERSFD